MINQEQLVEIHVLHQQRRSIFVTSLMSSVVDELIWPKDKRIFHTFDYPLNANLAKSLTHFCPKVCCDRLSSEFQLGGNLSNETYPYAWLTYSECNLMIAKKYECAKNSLVVVRERYE